MEVILSENLEKIAMVVTAHPDDAEWGCSGSVAKWTRLGWDVIYVLCTDGSKGTEDRSISSNRLEAELKIYPYVNSKLFSVLTYKNIYHDLFFGFQSLHIHLE